MTENCKLRKAILSAFYNISQRNFVILLMLWCSFKLWWNFCLDLFRSKFSLLVLRKWSIEAPFTWDQDVAKPEWKLNLSTCLHETGTEITKFSIYSSCAGNFLFSMAFVSMCCSIVKVTAETGLKCICVHSSRSEFMPVLSQSARSSRRNDLISVWVIFVTGLM
jgi:hypothetical protein